MADARGTAALALTSETPRSWETEMTRGGWAGAGARGRPAAGERRRPGSRARGRLAAAEGVTARVGDEREGIWVGDGPGLNYFRVQVLCGLLHKQAVGKGSKIGIFFLFFSAATCFKFFEFFNIGSTCDFVTPR